MATNMILLLDVVGRGTLLKRTSIPCMHDKRVFRTFAYLFSPICLILFPSLTWQGPSHVHSVLLLLLSLGSQRGFVNWKSQWWQKKWENMYHDGKMKVKLPEVTLSSWNHWAENGNDQRRMCMSWLKRTHRYNSCGSSFKVYKIIWTKKKN